MLSAFHSERSTGDFLFGRLSTRQYSISQSAADDLSTESKRSITGRSGRNGSQADYCERSMASSSQEFVLLGCLDAVLEFVSMTLAAVSCCARRYGVAPKSNPIWSLLVRAAFQEQQRIGSLVDDGSLLVPRNPWPVVGTIFRSRMQPRRYILLLFFPLCLHYSACSFLYFLSTIRSTEDALTARIRPANDADQSRIVME